MRQTFSLDLSTSGKTDFEFRIADTLVKLLLTLSATTIALISATIGYLYVTHGLSAPSHAPIAAFLCGGVSFLAVRAGCGVLADATDSIFICYAIDRENGTNHCDAAAQAVSVEATLCGRLVG